MVEAATGEKGRPWSSAARMIPGRVSGWSTTRRHRAEALAIARRLMMEPMRAQPEDSVQRAPVRGPDEDPEDLLDLTRPTRAPVLRAAGCGGCSMARSARIQADYGQTLVCAFGFITGFP